MRWTWPSLATTRPARTSSTYVLALLCFILGLLSKPMLVTLPCLLLLLDYWPLERLSFDGRRPAPVLRSVVLEKVPFFALSGLACVATLWTQREAGALKTLSSLPLWMRLENAAVAYARYLGKLFWPAGLALPYSPAPHWPWATVAYAAALLAGVSALALWVARQAPRAGGHRLVPARPQTAAAFAGGPQRPGRGTRPGRPRPGGAGLPGPGPATGVSGVNAVGAGGEGEK